MHDRTDEEATERQQLEQPDERPQISDQAAIQSFSRNPSQQRGQDHNRHPPRENTRTTSPSNKAFFTSTSHVEPVAQRSVRALPPQDPPPSPIQILCDGADSVTRDLRSGTCHHPTFQYSNCSGKKKAVCVSYQMPVFQCYQMIDCLKRLDWHQLHWAKSRIARVH